MKIVRATFDGVGGVPDVTLDWGDAGHLGDAPYVVTGPPGSGKTRLLQAICLGKEKVAPYGNPGPGHGWVRGEGRAAKIAIHWLLDEAERRATGGGAVPIATEVVIGPPSSLPPAIDDALLHVLERYDHHPDASKLEYFPPRRRLPLSTYAYVGKPPSLASKKRSRLAASDDKYDAIRQFLLELALGLHEHSTEGEEGGERFGSAFSALCASKQFEGITHGANGQRIVFSDAVGSRYDLDHLSDSEKQAVIFAATFTELNLHDSVVLIDSPELHLADAEVPAFVRALCTLGRNNQIIVATASPALIASVPSRRVTRLK